MTKKNFKSVWPNAGGVAVLKVGGASEVEVKERKDRVDDALHATRAAVEEGIVPGGGVTLLYASKSLEGLKAENDDQQAGVNIVKRALQAPVRQIAENGGVDGAVVAGKLMESKDAKHGFDAQKLDYCDMIKAGIIDPTKVVRTALQDAASVASLLITTRQLLLTSSKKKAPSAVLACLIWAVWVEWEAWAVWASKLPPTIKPISPAG